MSNFLAIATVTASLQKILQAAVQIDIEGARVTTVRPGQVGGGVPETGVNLFLYDVLLNPPVRSTELRGRNSDGSASRRTKAAIDLYYLVSVYGNDTELEPQRLLGSVIRTLHSRPYLTAQTIRETVGDSNLTYLADSDLADQAEAMSIIPVDLSVEELSKMWSVFFQTPYALSVAYKLSVVMIDSEEVARRALPARELVPRVSASQPTIEVLRIVENGLTQVWRSNGNQLILATSTLLIQGKRLSSDLTLVRVGDAKMTPQDVTDTQLTLDLSLLPADSLRAGVQGLQVIHPNRQTTSNVMAIVVRPSITGISLTNFEDNGDETCAADLIVQVNPMVGSGQRVTLLLNERSTESSAGYVVEIPPCADTTNLVTIPLRDVQLAEYLVRIQVDGAESLLSVDSDPESETFNQYNGPTVVIG